MRGSHKHILNKYIPRADINNKESQELDETSVEIKLDSAPDILMMSELPDGGPKRGNVYIEKDGEKLRYVVRCPKGLTVIDWIDIYVENVTTESLIYHRDYIFNQMIIRDHIKKIKKLKGRIEMTGDWFIDNVRNIVTAFRWYGGSVYWVQLSDKECTSESNLRGSIHRAQYSFDKLRKMMMCNNSIFKSHPITLLRGICFCRSIYAAGYTVCNDKIDKFDEMLGLIRKGEKNAKC